MRKQSDLENAKRKRQPWMVSPTEKQKLGQVGEEFAVQFLRAKGFSVVDRNVHFASGELDVVALIADELVFIEVKTRSGSDFGAAVAVSPRKMVRMRRSAGVWLASCAESSWSSVRFDVITVLLRGNSAPEITHYEAVDRGAR